MVVDTGQVDPPLDSLGKRIESASDVVPIKAKIEREMVPRSRRDADMRDVMLHRDGRDDRLRAITAGHSDHICSGESRSLRQLTQIVARREQDALDVPVSGLLDEVGALSFAAPRLGVDDED